MSLNVDKNTECVQTSFYDRRGTFRYRCLRYRCLRYRYLRYREFTVHGSADKLDTNEFLQKVLLLKFVDQDRAFLAYKFRLRGVNYHQLDMRYSLI